MVIFKAIFSALLSLVLKIRHFLFDIGILKSTSFDIPIITIGNLKVGGTGKTPMAEMLISNYKGRYKVALLSRGYGRKTSGYIVADDTATSSTIGDEPMLIHHKHPDIVVAVCEKRVVGVRKIMKQFPDVNLIILDDAYQHRYIDSSVDILLTEYDKPYFSDFLLPYGRLRDSRSQAMRANFVVVTKCPAELSPIDLRTLSLRFNLKPYQSIFFTRMVECALMPLFDRGYEEDIKEIHSGDKVILVSAIANPNHLIASIESRYNLIDIHTYRDHYRYKQADIDNILAQAVESNAFILFTDKDAAKIINLNIPSSEKFRLYTAPITIEFVDMEKRDNEAQFIDYVEKIFKSKYGKYCIKHNQLNY